MTEYRIVFNERTGRYRVERRRWWGWGFVMDAAGEDYLSFADYRDAQCFVCRQRRPLSGEQRRWKVVDPCERLCPGT